MKSKVAQKWVETLLSGKYKQGKSQLGMASNGGWLQEDQTTGKYPQPSKFCCLGVLCDLYNKTKEGKRNPVEGLAWANGVLPTRVQEWAGMSTADGQYKDGNRVVRQHSSLEYNLANLNDV